MEIPKLIENYSFHQWFADPMNQILMKRIIDKEAALRAAELERDCAKYKDLEWVSTPSATVRVLRQKTIS